MGVYRLDCPWCGLSRSAFTIAAERAYADNPGNNFRDMTASCGGCGKWVLMTAFVQHHVGNVKFKEHNGEISADWFGNLRVWPKVPSTDAPAHTDTAAAKAFTQALKALQRNDWDAAGMMAGKALEIATTALGKKLLNKDYTRHDHLKKRIDDLGAAHAITPQLVEWADAIRDDRNDAAHDEFSEQDANAICEFTDTFFEYVFTMPAKLEARKKKFDPPKGGGA